MDEQEVDEQTLLEHIRSDSIQAINLAVLIEDELSIELDDEEIDLEFFECFDLITKLVVRHLNITYTGG